MATTANPSTVRKDQVGTLFRVTIKDDADDSVVDVSGATTKEIRAKAPDGTTVTKTASFTTDGTDGQIEFTDGAGELTGATGVWTYWGYVELPGGLWGQSTALRYEVVEAGE